MEWLAECKGEVAEDFGNLARGDLEEVPRASGCVLRGVPAHESHEMVLHRVGPHTLWACSTCGRFATDVMRKLSQPCQGFASATGKANLRRLHRGLHPGTSRAARGWNQQSFRKRGRRRE